MAIHDNPRIVTNGLVLHLDAANIRSYPGSGTTWTDLSGRGNNGSLVNSPTFNSSGYFTLDGVDDHITVPTSTLWNFGTGDFTIEMWVHPTTYTSTSNSPTLLVIRPYNFASPSGMLFYLNNTGNLSVYTDITVSSTVNAPLNIWTHCVFTRLSGTLNFYAQAISGTSTSSFSSYSITNSQDMGIGFDTNFSSDFFTGRISSVKIYSKGLSASEVRQNFNALRGRFGI